MSDCPDLDSIQRKERRLIKIKQKLREEKRQKTIKTRTGKSVPMPSLPAKPLEVGISPENGIPVKPNLDMRLRKRAKKKI